MLFDVFQTKFLPKTRKKIFFHHFNYDMAKFLDIYCEDYNRKKIFEKLYEIKMEEAEIKFLKDQQNERKMYSTDSIDRRWRKTMERRIKEEKVLEMMKEKETSMLSSLESDKNIEILTEDEFDSDLFEYNQPFSPTQFRKRKRVVIACSHDNKDPMPENFKHIRNSINVVRPEFYSTVYLLISKYQCSIMQALAGVIETGKLMFNRKYWKYHTEDTTCLDLDTAPHNKNIRRAGQAIHALSLGCLVEEIMESDDGTVITYHTDGSGTHGVGSYTVQGITINSRYQSLPALPISSKSRANLALLKKTVLSILSAVSGVPMKDIFKKISYQMTDAAVQNFQVDNIIASDFEVDHVPIHLLCQLTFTHPCLMFIKKELKVFSDIKLSIVPDKIYLNFLVNATTSHETVFKQYIDNILIV